MLEAEGPIAFDNLLLDNSRRTVELDRLQLRLTKTEFELLKLLMGSGGAVISRDDLIAHVWGPGWIGDSHHLEVHLSRLRRKLLDAGAHASLVTSVRGIGYRMVSRAEDASRGGTTSALAAAGHQAFRLEYDHALILASVHPDDRPFLGWQPHLVIGTYHMLTTNALIRRSRPAGISMVRAIVASGITHWSARMPLRHSDGSISVHLVNTELQVIGRSGFNGMISEVASG